jgi:uncharacterized membrane protein YoaK (UPF0700 family)
MNATRDSSVGSQRVRPSAPQPIAAALTVAAVLAGVAGWVDTVGFIGLHGVFTAHVTGNLVLLGSRVAAPGEVAAKLLVLPAFVAGVAFAASLHTLARGRFSLLLWFHVAALTCFLVAGAWAANLVAACAGGFAMGVQNAHGRLSVHAIGPTTAMTGNVTQLVLEGMGAVGLIAADRVRARRRLLGTLVPVAGFAAGCLGGGLAYLAWSFCALLVPIAALALVAIASE